MSKPKALIGFAGFGGPEIALREAGIEATGIEMDPAIAEVNRVNGGHCLAADLLGIDPADYVGWLLFHFSPPCPNFSIAKSGNSEQESDLALARKICEFIRVGRPVYFTLENVWLYRKSLSWLLIWYTLLQEGYGVDAWHLNSADYGVPQTRRRMIVIARRDGRQPAKPWPTHSKTGDMFTKPWRGWWEAIEDLIPGLPETSPASWQIDRMPNEIKTLLVMTGNTNRNGVDNRPGRGCLVSSEPANTVTTILGGAMPRAFIIDSGNDNANGGKNRLTIRQSDEPIFTVMAGSRWVSMSVRCLARFQDFPDSFVLPDNKILACRGIGNALPPGLYRAVLKSLNLI
jgi:DNA (cytosine-5)-methyltransferase 1